ncbi:MAG: ribonuclease H-like domain-containing protein [Nitrospirae bacterium]|nr:ribonuclease H-like domain-containing protein [Nitrospirota bacterium]
MIRHTFSLLNGIGEKLELKIWQQGILTWDDFCNAEYIEGISPDRKIQYDEQLKKASEELHKGNAEYFTKTVRRKEQWRLYKTFRDNAVCLDIETNGYQPGSGGYPTVVGLYNGFDWRYLLRGENLSAENINKELYGYKCLITFYGSVFDVPYLQRSMPGVRFDIPHFDLCFASRKLGIEGGLKKIEQLFGIERQEAVKGIDGYAAVKLWEQARRGSTEARDLLLMYNREDTLSLLKLADIFYEKLKDSTRIAEFICCSA